MTRGEPAQPRRRVDDPGQRQALPDAVPEAERQPDVQRSARGHAHLAASARRTLGVQVTVAQRVADVPAPLFSAVVAAAASVVAVLLRPQSTPRGLGLPLDAALVAVCAAAIVVQARVAVRRAGAVARGGGLGAAALPVAALCSLFVALAGSNSWAVTVSAGVLCAAGVALSSHLDALRAAGREGGRERILGDAAGTAVMIPIGLAGASDGLADLPRGGVVLLVAGLLVVAATPPAPFPRSVAPGAAAGLLTALATPLAVHAGSQASGAAGLLLLWYGLRGLAGLTLGGPRDKMAVVEYLVVAAGAVALLVTQARG